LAVARSRGPRAARPPLLRLLPIGASFAAYGALRWVALRALVTDDAVLHGWPWYAPLSAVGTYATMVFDPRPNAQIGALMPPSRAAAVLGAAVFLTAAIAVARLIR